MSSELIHYRITHVELEPYADVHKYTLRATVECVVSTGVARHVVRFYQARNTYDNGTLLPEHFLYRVGDEFYYKPITREYEGIARSYGSTEEDPIFRFDGHQVHPTFTEVRARVDAYNDSFVLPETEADQRYEAIRGVLMTHNRSPWEKRHLKRFLFASLALIYREEWNDAATRERVLLGQTHHSKIMIESPRRAYKSSSIAIFVAALFQLGGGIKIRIISPGMRVRNNIHKMVHMILLPSPTNHIVENKSQLICGTNEIHFDVSEQLRCTHRPVYDITFVDEIFFMPPGLRDSITSNVVVAIGTPPHEHSIHESASYYHRI